MKAVYTREGKWATSFSSTIVFGTSAKRKRASQSWRFALLLALSSFQISGGRDDRAAGDEGCHAIAIDSDRLYHGSWPAPANVGFGYLRSTVRRDIHPNVTPMYKFQSYSLVQ